MRSQGACYINPYSGSLTELCLCSSVCKHICADIMFTPCPASKTPLSHCLQVQIYSLTAQKSVRPSAIRIAAGCRALCPLMGARAQITAATFTCPAWTQSRTQRYLKDQSKRLWMISHSPPLAKRHHLVTTTKTTTILKIITSATTKAP